LLVEIVEETERRKTSPVNNKDLAEQMAGMGPGEGKEVHLSPILHKDTETNNVSLADGRF
jgi:hypothetical protein